MTHHPNKRIYILRTYQWNYSSDDDSSDDDSLNREFELEVRMIYYAPVINIEHIEHDIRNVRYISLVKISPYKFKSLQEYKLYIECIQLIKRLSPFFDLI